MSAIHQPNLSTCISSDLDDEIGDKFMYATGRIIDQVILVSSPLDFSVGAYENVYHEYENVPELMEQSQILRSKETDGSYIAGGGSSNAFWRTLMGDCLLSQHDIPSPFSNLRELGDDVYKPLLRRAKARDFPAFLILWLIQTRHHFSRDSERYSVYSDWEPEYHDHDAEDTDSESETLPAEKSSIPPHYGESIRGILDLKAAEKIAKLVSVQDIRASVARATSGRLMFVTPEEYIGLGLNSMVKGGHVAILLGGSTPSILTHGNDPHNHYNLLGDGYVHGWMDGELIRSENIDEWEELVLV